MCPSVSELSADSAGEQLIKGAASKREQRKREMEERDCRMEWQRETTTEWRRGRWRHGFEWERQHMETKPILRKCLSNFAKQLIIIIFSLSIHLSLFPPSFTGRNKMGKTSFNTVLASM